MLESLFSKTSTKVFYCDYCKIFRNIFFTEHLQTTASESQLTKSLKSHLAFPIYANIIVFSIIATFPIWYLFVKIKFVFFFIIARQQTRIPNDGLI